MFGGIPTDISGLPEDPEKTNKKRSKVLERKRKELVEAFPEYHPEALLASLYSFEDMKRISTCEITIAQTGSERGKLNDSRMGFSDTRSVCTQCGNQRRCLGHFGLIRFPKMIYHPLLIRKIVYVLISVCNDCSRCLLTEQQVKDFDLMKNRDRLVAIANFCGKDLQCTREDRTTVKCSGLHIERSREGKLKPSVRTGPISPCRENPTYITSNIKSTEEVKYKQKYSGKDGGEEFRTPEDVFKILDGISDDDAVLLGIGTRNRDGKINNHPRNFILQGMLMMPPNSRPPTINKDLQKIGPITEHYRKIVLANEAWKKALEMIEKGETKPRKKGEEEKKGTENERRALFKEVKNLMVGTKQPGNRSDTGTQGGSVKEIISTKEGLIRSKQQAKRTNNVLRTVLGNDSSLKFGEISIPLEVARTLTKRVMVFENSVGGNKKQLQQLLYEGKINFVTKGSTGVREQISPEIPYNLEVGDIVERWLQNGDRVIFNRQPTLHKQSMMSYTVVLSNNRIIGLHPSCCTPHNADFDGDEGNVWIILGVEAEAEAQELMDVRKCIMLNSQSRPTVGLILDEVTGAFRMTEPNNRISREFFEQCYMQCTNPPEIQEYYDRLDKFSCCLFVRTHYLLDSETEEGERKYLQKDMTDYPYNKLPEVIPGKSYILRQIAGDIPSKCLFGLLLPSDFQYEKAGVKIIDGVLISGRITKDHVGATRGSIIHYLWKEPNGEEKSVDFLTDSNYMINYFTTQVGITVGASDCILPEDKKRELQKDIESVETNISAIYAGRDSFKSEQEVESKTLTEIGKLTATGMRVGKDFLSKQNHLGEMTDKTGSGAKGGVLQLGQISTLVGQQLFHGQRPEKLMTSGTRCLPCFDANDPSLSSRGFSKNSFWEGQSPEEFYFGGIGAREGLVSIAVNVSTSGDTQRKMTKSLEGIRVAVDGSVRSPNGFIYQMVYGGNGLDSSQLIGVRSNYIDDCISFVDFDALARKINSEAGWVTA